MDGSYYVALLRVKVLMSPAMWLITLECTPIVASGSPGRLLSCCGPCVVGLLVLGCTIIELFSDFTFNWGHLLIILHTLVMFI